MRSQLRDLDRVFADVVSFAEPPLWFGVVRADRWPEAVAFLELWGADFLALEVAVGTVALGYHVVATQCVCGKPDCDGCRSPGLALARSETPVGMGLLWCDLLALHTNCKLYIAGDPLTGSTGLQWVCSKLHANHTASDGWAEAARAVVAANQGDDPDWGAMAAV